MKKGFSIALALGAFISMASVAQTPPPAKSDAPPSASAPAAAPAPAPATPASVLVAAVRSDHAMEGLAAYYSNRFEGHKTASGQIFRQGALTAAHQTLAFGTKVKVTNTRNGRSVIVRINDRGPTQAGRVIDLSRAAANKLGIRRAGLAPVKLEVVEEAPPGKNGQ